MGIVKDVAWWYWAATAVLLAGALAGCPMGFDPVEAVAAAHALHYLLREQSVSAFPVQVRLVYLALLFLGQVEPLGFIGWIQLVGTTAMVVFDYCVFARLLSLLPFNRQEPISARLLQRTFLSPPVKGGVLRPRPAD
jgi:hypothetical protein